MAVFAVMSSGANPTLVGNAITREFPENNLMIAPGQYLVAAHGMTTKEITERLGGTAGALGQIVVLSTTSYYGWHTKEVWEWIQVKS